MRGKLLIKTFDLEGNLLDQQQANNKIVLGGRDFVANLVRGQIVDPTPNAIAFMGIGEDGTPTDEEGGVGISDLVDPIARRPLNPFQSADIFVDNSDPANPRTGLRMSIDLPPNDPDFDGRGLQEAGLFTAVTDGVMYNRVTFAVITKSANVQLSLIWEVLF
ncbi:MAG: hypothetical protein AAGC85_03940 [Bacteroidota bacterium]